jgi:chromosome segregation ATPase
MRFAHLPATITSIALLTLSGCAAFSGDSDTSSSPPVATSAEKSTSSSSERRTSASESTSRDERSTATPTRDSRSTSSSGEPGKTDLVSQLNDASRELAALRAANAKLRAERTSTSAATTTSAPTARPTPADEKLNQALRSYNQFRQEITTLVADLEKLRAENASLSSQLKEAVAKSQQGSGTFAKLEREVQAERDARLEAERTIASLREQLRAVARAVKEAGVDPARSGR